MESDLTTNGLIEIQSTDIFTDYLTVYEDLTVYGNQIFIGNQIVSGNLSVSGNLNGITANISTLNNTGTITTSGLVVSNNTRIRGNLSVSGTLSVSNNVEVGGTGIFNNISVTENLTTSGLFVDNTARCNFLQTTSINSNYIFNSGLMEAGNITVDTQWVKNELNFVDNLFLDPPVGTIRYDANQLQYNLIEPTQLQDLSHRFRINSNEHFIISSGNAEFKGSVNIATTASAQYFSGNGAGLTGIDVLSISGVLPVNRGGTNTSILTANKIMVGNGTNGVLTPAGLHWDNANSRLGVLTATPGSTVDIAGTLKVSGVVAFANNLTVSGNATFVSTISASGLFVSQNAIINNDLLVVVDSTFGQSLSTSGLFVSNNSLVRGTLLVSGNTTFGSSLSSSGLFVSNNSLMNGTLIVGGNATFGQNLSMSGLRVSNNASITGTLIVQGNATFGNNVSTSSLRVSNNASITGTLLVQGNATFSQTLSMSALSVSNNVIIVGSSTFNGKTTISSSLALTSGYLSNSLLNIENTLAGGESLIAIRNKPALGTTYTQWDLGATDSTNFVLNRHTDNEFETQVLEVAANAGQCNINMFGATTIQPANPTVSTALYTSVPWNGTNAEVAKFVNSYNGRDAWISIQNTNSITGDFQNKMKLGVDANGDLAIEDENSIRRIQFDTSGYCQLSDGLSIPANSTAFPGSGGGIAKGIFMKYSINGGQDQGYIQSINRTTSQTYPLVIQSNQMWLNGDRKASAVVPAGVNIVGAGNGFGMTGSTLHHYISSDNYPLISHLAFTHNNEGIAFGMYYDGTNWRASDAGSQYSIYKLGGELLFNFDDVAIQGATCNGTDSAFKVQLNGGTVFNYAQTNNVKVNSPFFIANFSGLTGIAGFPSRIISSATLASEWIASFNQSDAGTGSRGVIFTRSGTILGAVRYDAAGVAYMTSSDYRLKEDIRPYCCGLSMIRRLNPVLYKWKADGSDGQGFIAHELQEVIPEAVYGTKDAVNEDGTPDVQSVDMTRIIPCMVKAIQQLDTKVSNLGGTNVDTLLEENRILKERLDALEAKLRKAFVI